MHSFKVQGGVEEFCQLILSVSGEDLIVLGRVTRRI